MKSLIYSIDSKLSITLVITLAITSTMMQNQKSEFLTAAIVKIHDSIVSYFQKPISGPSNCDIELRNSGDIVLGLSRDYVVIQYDPNTLQIRITFGDRISSADQKIFQLHQPKWFTEILITIASDQYDDEKIKYDYTGLSCVHLAFDVDLCRNDEIIYDIYGGAERRRIISSNLLYYISEMIRQHLADVKYMPDFLEK